MFITYQSNDLVNLSACLTEVLKTGSVGSPLQPEIIVVSNPGMARWLSLQIADRLGVCANIHFQFPAEYIWHALRQFFTDVPHQSPMRVDTVRWRIMAVLPELLNRPEFTSVVRYLEEGDRLKQYELSQQIAQVFDRYLVYRPEWVCAWERGEQNHWQAQLWREVVQPAGMMHWAQLLQRLQQVPKSPPSPLLQRVLFFAVATLSPGYIQALSVIGQHSDCHLFMRNPCRVYWNDIKSKRDIIRHELQNGESDMEHYFETGNSLLAAWGREGREYLSNVLELHSEDIECFIEYPTDTLLGKIQSDILNLEEPGSPMSNPTLIADTDASIKVAVVHSPMREMEVLHDQLLAMLDSDPTIQATDIVVMMPDVEKYAPYIDAVFSSLDHQKRIPYRIADSRSLSETPVARTFLALLNLPDSRFENTFILELLECDALRVQFSFGDEDLPILQTLIREAGVRWGIDAAHKATLGLPESHEHSWQFGLDRLLLGYSMEGEGANIFSGIHPVSDIEGECTRLVSSLIHFIKYLNAWRKRLQQTRLMTAWMTLCQQLLLTFFDDESNDLEFIHQALDSINTAVSDSEFNERIELNLVKESVINALESTVIRDQFLGKGVTFCALLPLRSIPFKIVCLIGMGGADFPRFDKRLGFDLLRQHPKPGDRSARNEDRYLFLEALTSAQHYFYISYVGQHIKDNSVIPPCVLVSELLDYIDGSYVLHNNDAPSSVLVTRHPLQGFSARYFNEKEAALFTYSKEYQSTSLVSTVQTENNLPCFAERLMTPEEHWRQVSLTDLIQFYNMPSRYLLKRRLKVSLDIYEENLETAEPFNMDKAAERQLDHALLNLHLEQTETQQVQHHMQAAGLLPHGQPGKIQFAHHHATSKKYQHDLALLMENESLGIAEFKVNLGAFTLYGELSGICNQGLFITQINPFSAKDTLSAWLSHLVLNLLERTETKTESFLVSKVQSWRFTAVNNAEKLLTPFLDWYWQGLQQPLKFFPTASQIYYSQLKSKRAKISPLDAAANKWQGSDYHWGEGQDPYNQLAFRNTEVFDDEFIEIAMQVFEPLHEHLEKL